MMFSNSTLDELRREAEETDNKLALAILDRIPDAIRDEVIAETKEYETRMEILEGAIHQTNYYLSQAVAETMVDIFNSEGGKRKTSTALKELQMRFDAYILSDAAEVLDGFVPDVVKRVKEELDLK